MPAHPTICKNVQNECTSTSLKILSIYIPPFQHKRESTVQQINESDVPAYQARTHAHTKSPKPYPSHTKHHPTPIETSHTSLHRAPLSKNPKNKHSRSTDQSHASPYVALPLPASTHARTLPISTTPPSSPDHAPTIHQDDPPRSYAHKISPAAHMAGSDPNSNRTNVLDWRLTRKLRSSSRPMTIRSVRCISHSSKHVRVIRPVPDACWWRCFVPVRIAVS